MVKQVETSLPSPGDAVQVAWGLGSVRGRVIEAYSGIRPRVVVEVDAGEVADESTTITVPVGALEPLAESNSPWAQATRVELALANALERTLGDRIEGVQVNAELEYSEIDLLVHLSDGRELLVDVKFGASNLDVLRADLDRIGKLASKRDGLAMLVIVAGRPNLSHLPMRKNTGVAVWSDKNDDRQLREVVTKLLKS